MSGIDLSLREAGFGTHVIDYVWAVVALGMIVAMAAYRSTETVSYHLLFFSMAAMYGVRLWPLRQTLWITAAVSVASSAVLIDSYRIGYIPVDELAEIPLMPMIVVAMAWHARMRGGAQREAERLAERERELASRQREFLREAAHSLRTPMTIARGHVELVKTLSHVPQVDEDCDVVLHQLDRASVIIRRLLLIEQLRLDRELVIRPVDLADALERIVARWRVAWPRGWRTQIAATGLVPVDVERLELALEALAENAVRFTAPGDPVLVTVRRQTGGRLSAGREPPAPSHPGAAAVSPPPVRPLQPAGAAAGPAAAPATSPGEWVVTVEDCGPGVPPEHRARVFTKFWRRTAPGEEPGSGLGLALVRAVAVAHGGWADVVDSDLGGANFRLALPVTDARSCFR